MVYRQLSAQPMAQAAFDELLQDLEAALKANKLDPNEIVRNTLCKMYFGRAWASAVKELSGGENLLPARALMHSFDPRNVTTEPEYYSDLDPKQYAVRKPFIWLWQMFDRSPMGQNALFGHRLRALLAPLIFRSVGRNFKCWSFVEWSFGYNLSIGENVVIHRHVLLDDRGGIEIGNNVSVSDYVNIYSHSHDIDDIEKVSNRITKISDHVRITYHATVLAGVSIGKHAMIGTGAVVTRDIEPYHIAIGIPAKTVKVKAVPQ